MPGDQLLALPDPDLKQLYLCENIFHDMDCTDYEWWQAIVYHFLELSIQQPPYLTVNISAISWQVTRSSQSNVNFCLFSSSFICRNRSNLYYPTARPKNGH